MATSYTAALRTQFSPESVQDLVRRAASLGLHTGYSLKHSYLCNYSHLTQHIAESRQTD